MKKLAMQVLSLMLGVMLLISAATVEASVNSWNCPVCGSTNTGSFCPDCGTAATAAAEDDTLTSLSEGDCFTFGTYPQTASGKDKTPIEWQVLMVKDDKALVISRYGLDVQPYNTDLKDVTWETCTLRTWLNDTFYNTAFTKEEKQRIMTATVYNTQTQCYSGWETVGGNNTKDKIFLLSYTEASRFFGVKHYNENGAGNNTVSRVQPTEYAIKNGTATEYFKTADGSASGRWWLRSPGYDQASAAYVGVDGACAFFIVDYGILCVRPAFWIKLDSSMTASIVATATPKPAATPTPAPEITLKKGDTITLGTYPQTKSGKDKTPIEWIVLDVQDGNAFVMSRYGLDSRKFNSTDGVTWEKSEIRTWLNNSFMKTAFTEAEKKAIKKTSVDGGASSYVYLMSYDEYSKYLTTNELRLCESTEYTRRKGAGFYDGTCCWWLRSVFFMWNKIELGRTPAGGDTIAAASETGIAVRPVMWVKIASLPSA